MMRFADYLIQGLNFGPPCRTDCAVVTWTSVISHISLACQEISLLRRDWATLHGILQLVDLRVALSICASVVLSDHFYFKFALPKFLMLTLHISWTTVHVSWWD